MTDEQTPGTDDDVDAHALKSGRDAAQLAETQAHALRSGRRHDETGPDAGTERDGTDEDDDVEGHGVRIKI